MKMKSFFITVGLLLLVQGCANKDLRKDSQLRNDSDLTALHRAAQTAYDSGDDKKAEAAYQSLSVKQPQDAETWLRLGNIYARNKMLDKAVDAYKKSLQINPADGRSLNNISIVHLRQAWIAALGARQASGPEQAAYQISGEIIDALENLPYVTNLPSSVARQGQPSVNSNPIIGTEKLVLDQAKGKASAVDKKILPQELVSSKEVAKAPQAVTPAAKGKQENFPVVDVDAIINKTQIEAAPAPAPAPVAVAPAPAAVAPAVVEVDPAPAAVAPAAAEVAPVAVEASITPVEAVVSKTEADEISAEVNKIRGVNPANLAASFYVRVLKQSVLIIKNAEDASQNEVRIALASGENKRIPISPNEIFKVEQGGRMEIFYQGYPVPKNLIENGAWMQLVPAKSKSKP